MAPESFKRKLIAILSADVKGYSRLMGEDEEGTIRILNAYMEVITCCIQQHRGRVVATGGDSVLAEFASVVDAVRCAVGIQEELRDRNKELPEGRRMEFRIGVNLGDVVEEGDNILGDGVNVAARVQSLAEVGGISISGTAYDQIKNKLAFGYEFLGEQTVKNIKEPVRVYRVRMDPEVSSAKLKEEKKSTRKGLSKAALTIITVLVIAGGAILYQFALRPSPSKVEIASKEKMAFPLPDKPSIAVLPFANMSDDPKQKYFSDGLTEEIITALSKTPQIFVIARNSTFTYKGKSVKVKQVAEELGVQYVLEGSVRWVGDKVRITAQLIDALTGNHLWAERYDRDPKDIFALQDEITIAIVRALRVTVTSGEQARLTGRGTKNLDAYLKAIQASEKFLLFNREGSVRAKEFAMEAIVLDPRYAYPYAILANAHMLDVWFRFSESPEESMRRADDTAHKALDLDDSDPYIHSALTNLYVMQRQYDKAIASAERSLEISPGSAGSQNAMAWALMFACRFHEAIPFYEEAIRLDPYPPGTVFRGLGSAYDAVGRTDESLRSLQKALRLTPTDIFVHLGLAALYVELGREEDARAEAKEVLRLHPKFSLEQLAKAYTFKDQAFVDRRMELYRKAGLK